MNSTTPSAATVSEGLKFLGLDTDTPPKTFLERANAMLSLGIPVVPLLPKSKDPCTPHAAYDATADSDIVVRWAKKYDPSSNCAAVARFDGFWMLDDDLGALAEKYKADTGQDFPSTLSVKTSRGFHYYFLHDDASRLIRYGVHENSGVIAIPGYKGEARCNYQYVVAPGSVHPSGARYTISRDVPIIAAPVALLEWLQKAYEVSESLKPEHHKPKGPGKSDPGFRKLFDAVGYWPLIKRINALPDTNLHVTDLSRGETVPCPMPHHKHSDYTPCFGSIKDAPELLHCLGKCQWTGDMVAAVYKLDGGCVTYKTMYDAARAICKEENLDFEDFFPAKRVEALEHLEGCYEEEREIFRTDLGNSLRFVKQHREKVRHCAALGWLYWDGKRWKRDSKKKVIDLMKGTALSIIEEAKKLSVAGRNEEAENVFQWAMASQGANKIEAALKLAESDLAISVDADDLDHDPMLLNLPNGTLDLRTCELRPHSKADNITKLCPVSLSPEAECPKFEKFINRILPDSEVRDFVQRWFGYCLTGDNGEQTVFIGYGEGANGKSQLLELFRKLLGATYTARGTFDMVKLTNHGETRNDLARLKGIRLVTISESGEGVILDEAMIKDVTGGEAISARFLYKEFFDFVPEFKLTFATNYKPDIYGHDYAIWRRVCLVPFAVTIPEEEREDNIHARLLREEASGILNWTLQGLRNQQAYGLNPPDAIRAATEEYKDEQDLIGHFLADRCEAATDLFKAQYTVTAGDLYKAYNEWAKGAGYRPVSQKRLGQNLARRGLKQGRDSRSARTWQGVRVKGNCL